MKKNVKRFALVAGVAALAIAGFQVFAPSASAAPAAKITICHRAPNETHYVMISTKFLSPYGAWGHWDEGGNPEPGHEGDVLPIDGECPCLK